jgi:hypothetical protein
MGAEESTTVTTETTERYDSVPDNTDLIDQESDNTETNDIIDFDNLIYIDENSHKSGGSETKAPIYDENYREDIIPDSDNEPIIPDKVNNPIVPKTPEEPEESSIFTTLNISIFLVFIILAVIIAIIVIKRSRSGSSRSEL